LSEIGEVSFSSTARAPWFLHIDGTVLTVRGATARDLPGVALMHRRCSAKSLLDRYRTGGRPPAILVLDGQLREPLSFVATTEDGQIVATARLAAEAERAMSAEVALLVEDQWQRLGIGRALLRHCAAAAASSGYRQLVAYPGTTPGVVQQLMSGIGTTRSVSLAPRQLRTVLSADSRNWLGPLTSGSAPIRAVGC
jgi:N-acetylglutamate synthase-like GNAT family acetyltransferase